MSQNVVQDLWDAYNVRDIADWEILSDAAREIQWLRATLTVIAGSSDRLQATQALGALDNIGPNSRGSP